MPNGTIGYSLVHCVLSTRSLEDLIELIRCVQLKNIMLHLANSVV